MPAVFTLQLKSIVTMTITSPKSPRMIKVKWPQLDIVITVVMKDELNKTLIDLLYDNLPYRSLQNHALVSGDHLYHLVPTEKLIVSRRLHSDNTTILLINRL